MENKPGIVNEVSLDKAEREVIRLKLSLLDETYTFNESVYNYEFLFKLHNYLFGDFYDISYKEEEKEIMKGFVDKVMESINDMCVMGNINYDRLYTLISLLWRLQPFYDGNTRTILSYLIILNKAFDLKLDLNPNMLITSSETFFGDVLKLQKK